MPHKKKDKKASAAEPKTPMQELAALADYVLSIPLGTPRGLQIHIYRFRKALDAACREDVWQIVDDAFGRLVVTTYELLFRALIELRANLDHWDGKCPSGNQFPDIQQTTGRIERIARFLLELSRNYSKTKHVTQLAKREYPPEMKLVVVKEKRNGDRAAQKKARKKGTASKRRKAKKRGA